MHKTVLLCLSLASLLAVSLLFPKPVHAQINVAPTSLFFGNVAVNANSSPETFVVTNEGSQPRTISSVYSSIPEYSAVGPAMPLTLAAHASASFQLTVGRAPSPFPRPPLQAPDLRSAASLEP